MYVPNEPIDAQTFTFIPQNVLLSAKIQLPENFFTDLEKIENFYDLYLQELIPLTADKVEGNGASSHPEKEDPCYANRGKLVG